MKTEQSLTQRRGHLESELNGETIRGGNAEYIGYINSDTIQTVERLSHEGKTPVLFAKADKLLGVLGVADVIKEDSAQAIAELKRMGIHTVMLTGDNPVTAQAIAEQSGVDEVVASVKPDGKEEVIRKLKEAGSVTMVGDGINDAPALTSSDLGTFPEHLFGTV